MMRILLVSYLFPPNNAIGSVRMGKLAKYLTRQGHDVRVLCADDPDLPHDLAVEIPHSQIVRTGAFQINFLPKAILGRRRREFQRGTTTLSPTLLGMGGLYRTLFNVPDGQIGWLPVALSTGKRILSEWRPDVIYASALPFTSLIVAKRLAAKLGIPWVAELRDLWTENPYYDHPSWRRRIEQKLEAWVLRSAAAVVTVSEPLADSLREAHQRPTFVIRNGFDPEDYQSARPVEGVMDPQCLNIVYTGLIYYRRRDPSVLFRALSQMGADARRVRVHFFGRLLPEVKVLADQVGVGDLVKVHGAVSFQESNGVQMAADVLLLLMWNDPVEYGVLPGKLFEYVGAGRPILASGYTDGVAAQLIRDKGLGVVLDSEESIARQVREWIAQKDAGGVPGLSELVQAELSRDRQFCKLEPIFEGVISGAWRG